MTARTHLIAMIAPAALLTLSGCGDIPNPNDYGGGAEGKAIAQCIVRTERADSAITRPQAEEMCACVTERMASSMSSGQSSGQSALVRCAQEAGITID